MSAPALPSMPAVAPAKVVDADGYRSSIHGVTVDTVRNGAGRGPNRILSRPGDAVSVNAVSLGYPIISHSMVPDDRLVVTSIESSQGGRWVGLDVEPGLIVVYGPETEHMAINPAGMRFRFAVIDLAVTAGIADAIGVPFDIAERRGEVLTMSGTPEARRISRALRTAEAAIGDEAAPAKSDLTAAVARSLAPPRTMVVPHAARGIDDRYVVSRCIEFAEAVGRMPSIAEMCEEAHVSERRLRSAFTALYGMAPTRFFRTWALAKADHRLRSMEHHPGAVSRVAVDLGFNHLGRFAARYRETYGLMPSEAASSA